MLEVVWWGGEPLRDLSKNILKQGVGKGKICSKGGWGFQGVTTLSPENFTHTHSHEVQFPNNKFMDNTIQFIFT